MKTHAHTAIAELSGIPSVAGMGLRAVVVVGSKKGAGSKSHRGLGSGIVLCRTRPDLIVSR